jgi:hypothetical protein
MVGHPMNEHVAEELAILLRARDFRVLVHRPQPDLKPQLWRLSVMDVKLFTQYKTIFFLAREYGLRAIPVEAYNVEICE